MRTELEQGAGEWGETRKREDRRMRRGVRWGGVRIRPNLGAGRVEE